MKQSFSDRLTPGQIQLVFDALEIDWRPMYNPENGGWVNCYHDHLNSDIGINIYHGGWVDHYQSGDPDGKGDLVSLVAMHRCGIFYKPDLNPEDHKQAIAWIKDVLGMNRGVQPPDVPEGGTFAREWLQKENGNHYARMPLDILKSNLTPAEKLVWLAIFGRCGKNDVYAFPGIRRICEDTDLSMGTVQKSIKTLIKVGLLIEKPRGSNANKAPARFPLVLGKNSINNKIRVLKNEHPCSDNELPCSKNRTKLEPLIKTKELNTEANKCETSVYAHSLLCFSDSYSVPDYTLEENPKASQRSYDQCLNNVSAKVLIEKQRAGEEFAAEMARMEGYA